MMWEGVEEYKKEEIKMTSVVLWEPISETRTLSAMNRMLEETLSWPLYHYHRPHSFFADGARLMPIDIYDSGDNVIVKASLPGVKLEDVDITIRDNFLTIKGEFKTEKELEKAESVCQERFSGEFTRSVTLPEGLNTDKAEAVMDQGVLTLTIPKSEEVRPKSIRVKGKKEALTPGYAEEEIGQISGA